MPYKVKNEKVLQEVTHTRTHYCECVCAVKTTKNQSDIFFIN